MPLTPNNREEHWLQGMVDGETTLTPNNRREHWYKAIIDNGSGGGGGGGGALLKVGVTVEDGTATMDKTWAEIASVYENGLVFAHTVNPNDGALELSIVDWIAEHEGMYGVGLHNIEFGTTTIYVASSQDGYPTEMS